VNVGILAGIQHLTRQNKRFSKVHSFYNDELKSIKSSDIVSCLRKIAITNEVVAPTLLKKTETFIEYLIFLGVHKGFNFIVEYCQVMQQQDKSFDIQLLYYQCDLQQLLKDDNVRYDELIPRLKTMFKQFGCEKSPDFQKYRLLGQFLKADIIMLFQMRDKYRVVVIDVGLFSVPDITYVPDLRDVPAIKKRLRTTYHYMREKTAFESISIDSDKAGIPFSEKFSEFFEAFSRDDKDTEKMIQAGSYAYSFVQCLKKLQPQRFNDDTLEVNVIGLTDRAYNSMFISKKEDMPILSTIYRKSKKDSPDIDYPEKRILFQSSVFERISDEFKRTLERNKDNTLENPTIDTFVETLKTLPPSDTDAHKVAYTETLKNFSSTADNVPAAIMAEIGLADETLTFRQAHTQLTRQALNDDNEFLLFLTGHPGIGKTTAIVDYILDKQVLSEGILFFYFSPRTQVNYDIIEKVSEIQNGKRVVKDDNLMCIYSNSTLIRNYGGYPVIKYVCNTPLPQQLNMPSVIGGRKSILKLVADNEKEVHYRSASGTQSCSDTQIDYSSNAIQGVLNTVCSAICTIRQAFNTADNIPNIPKNIIATATVQSLKKTDISTTAKHLRKIFAEAAKDSKLNDFGDDGDQLKQIANTTKHLIFMVDEVIGDSGGAELLHELLKLSQQLKLYKHFQLKIIASDASIAGKDVIQQHLSKPEPSPAKVLYRQVSQRVDENAISIQKDKIGMGIYDLDATLINANTFPASEIVLRYNVSVEMASLEANRKKRDIGLAWLQEDIFKLLRLATDGQLIVYIQDIQKLHQLIKAISEKQATLPDKSFEEFKDYLLIHSRIGNEARQQIHQCKNTVKVIFMTSSASRGLTFARVRHILIEVPKFQIEYNLMEIIQTVYRGRGGETKKERAEDVIKMTLTVFLH
jgi:hypothetical protein